MAAPITMSTNERDINLYLCTLNYLPDPYYDPVMGTQVTFDWGRAGGTCPGVPVGDDTPTVGYHTSGGGFEAQYRALRKALILDWEKHNPVLSPPTGPTVYPRQEPSPAPTTPTVTQYTGPLIPATTTGETMATMPPPTLTTVPAPTSVAVTSRPTTTRTVLQPTSPTEDLLGAILGGVGGFLTGGPAGAVTGAIGGYYGTGGGETNSSPGVQNTGVGGGLVSGCPTGYEWDGTQCVQSGLGGLAARILPGGNTGTIPTTTAGSYGQAVMGAWGQPALVPAQVGTINGGPILRCPTGAVLGKDNLCYQKGSIPNKYRKWPRGSRPLLTGGEMKTLRKVRSLENKVKRAWTAAGKPGQRTCRRK